MDDLISRKAAIDAICKACSIDDDYVKCVERRPESTFCDEIVALRNVPSETYIDTSKELICSVNVDTDEIIERIKKLGWEPVKHGQWKKAYADHFGERPFYRYCSECCKVTVFPYNFCPNCGALMDGDKNE